MGSQIDVLLGKALSSSGLLKCCRYYQNIPLGSLSRGVRVGMGSLIPAHEIVWCQLGSLGQLILVSAWGLQV